MDERSGLPKLTHRELEVLALVAYGYSAKEIAGRLGNAPRTVERHTENVRLKLRARNRAHLITLAALYGYLQIGKPPERLECAECLFRPGRSDSLLDRLGATAEDENDEDELVRIVEAPTDLVQHGNGWHDHTRNRR